MLLAVVLVTVGCATGVDDDAHGRTDSGGVSETGSDGSLDDDAHSDGSIESGADGTSDGSGADGTTDGSGDDTGGSTDSGAAIDTGSALDSGVLDTGTSPDASPTGPITGGPCLSGASGVTAFRVKWINGGGKATVSYETLGLPDKSRWKVSAAGYTIGFSPSFVDPFLGDGGLQLDSSDFVDVELSTKGLASIKSATLAIYGRSFNTTTSGSFNWKTFSGTGATPTDWVSNVAPYKWYGGTATLAFVPGDGTVLLRIKSGLSSNALVVNRIELCMDAS